MNAHEWHQWKQAHIMALIPQPTGTLAERMLRAVYATEASKRAGLWYRQLKAVYSLVGLRPDADLCMVQDRIEDQAFAKS